MTGKNKTDDKNTDIIEITDEDGKTYKAEVIELITFKEKEYAVLAPAGETKAEKMHSCSEDGCDEDSFILMRVIQDGEEYYFETIDDDKEFEQVSEYIESLADEIDD